MDFKSGTTMSSNTSKTQVAPFILTGMLATGGYDHTIKIWQASTGNCVRTIKHPESQINALEINYDKTILASCGWKFIRLYDFKVENVNTLMSVSGNVTRVGFQKDGKWMYTAGEDGFVRLWEMNSRKCKRAFQCPVPVNAVCLHPNEVDMAIGLQNGSIYLWKIHSDQNETHLPENDVSIQDIAISPDGKYLSSVNNKGNCYIWSLGDGGLNILNPKAKIEAHKRKALRCKFSPNSEYLATAGVAEDASLKVWRTSNFTLVCELKDEINSARWIWDMAFSADSQNLYTASSCGMATLWNISDKEVKRQYSGHTKAVTALAFRD